jgi:outer membrane lipoprotein-sorting protein
MKRIGHLILRDQRRRRLRRVVLGLALSILISASGVARGEDKPKVNSWYAQTVARGSSGFNINYFWSLGSNFRAETVAAGHKIVTIVSGDTYFAYDAVMMKGVSIRRTPEAIAADAGKTRPFGNEVESLLDQGAEKIREETLFNTPSEVYQISDDNGRRIVWVTQDPRRLPMRIEIYDRRSGATSYKEYFDWQNGIPISEDFFTPEPAAQIKHFEFDEYIGSTDDREVMSLAPILYEELLIGPPKKGDAARSN